MEVFAITQYKDGISLELIRRELEANSGVVLVDYKMSSINSSNSYLDVTQDYLEASFIAEELGKFSTNVTASEVSRNPYPPDCRYEFIVRDFDLFALRLRELSIIFSGESDDAALDKHMEEIETFRETLDNRLFVCPDLVDGYYVNLIEGAYIELRYELGKGYIRGEYKKYPERKFGFWKSAYSQKYAHTIYMSMNSWVFPVQLEIDSVLREIFGFPEFEIYEEARRFSLDGDDFVVSKNSINYFPKDFALQLQRFVSFFLSKQSFYTLNLEKLFPEPKYFMSSSGYSLMIQDGVFNYLFFPKRMQENKILDLYKAISHLYGFVAELSGVKKDISLFWEKFDDDKFENLCYDIIYHSPEFDNKTITKMGKSRSRDGGRDITVYTNERPGIPKKLYIFQCKFTKVGTSLTTQKLINISDTVVQYGGQGYGVMTPVVIDSALYDRIEAICKKFSIESRNWSILDIERFIARHPKLRDRYFS